METEFKDERKYNVTNFFNEDTNRKQARAFLGPVYYDNKLLLGDGVPGLRGINNTLTWNSTRGGWTFLFNNFQPFIPEYCDSWFFYRDLFQGKDQIFGFKPRGVSHIQGRLVSSVPGLTDQNAVIFDNAFSAGIDLIIAFTSRKMKKIIRIRDGFKPTTDTDFDFLLSFPDGVGIYTFDLDTRSLTPLDPLTPKVIGLRSQIYIGTDQNDGKDWFTRVNPIRIWDSGVSGFGTGQRTGILPAIITTIGGVSVLRKRVTAEFLSTSVGDVFTDAATQKYGIFTNDSYDTLEKYGSLTTVWLPTANLKECWQSTEPRIRKLLNSTDKITVKYRFNEDESFQFTGTWTSTSTFTTTTDLTAYADYEVEVLNGTGGGKTAHITSVAYGTVWTVTLDDTFTGVTTGTFKGRVQNWKKSAVFSNQSESTPNFPFDMSENAPMIQIRLCFQWKGKNELFDIFINSTSQ